MQTLDEVTLIQCSTPYFTGIPEDVIVNTWHFLFDVGGATLPTVTDYGNAFDNLNAFYNAVYSAQARGSWVGPTMTMRAYSLWLPEPRVPAFTGTRNFSGSPAAGTTPTESSICLSYKATYISGVPQARQRGRIFLGGFADVCAAGSSTTFPQISVTVRNGIATAAENLLAAMTADNWTWVVLSPTQVAASLEETFEVTGGWIDNTPDTQRRRGVQATARTAWS